MFIMPPMLGFTRGIGFNAAQLTLYQIHLHMIILPIRFVILAELYIGIKVSYNWMSTVN